MNTHTNTLTLTCNACFRPALHGISSKRTGVNHQLCFTSLSHTHKHTHPHTHTSASNSADSLRQFTCFTHRHTHTFRVFSSHTCLPHSILLSSRHLPLPVSVPLRLCHLCVNVRECVSVCVCVCVRKRHVPVTLLR